MSDKTTMEPQSTLLVWQEKLSQYISALEKFAHEAENEKSFSQAMVNRLAILNSEIITEGEKLIKKINDKKISAKIKNEFRAAGGKWFYRSEMMDKGFRKYRGYPGDFEMMEFVYNNKIVTTDKLAAYFERGFLDNPYAIAVRGRKNKMVEILKRFVSSSEANRLNIMNVACGPCREIRELFSQRFNFNSRINYLCVDFEKEALDFSRKALINISSKVKARFVRENIMNLIRRPQLYQKRFGKYDLVYSIGLGDYLSDSIVKKLMKFCWYFLKPGGQMVFAHKIEDKDPLAPLDPDWFCDWEFVPRSESDVDNLIHSAGLVDFSIAKEWEESGRILFIRIIKSDK